MIDSPRVIIRSSHGEFRVDAATGKPVTWDPHYFASADAKALGRIDRFDFTEWERHYGKPIASISPIDILDLGYWLDDGTYEGPDHDWRKYFCVHLQKNQTPRSGSRQRVHASSQFPSDPEGEILHLGWDTESKSGSGPTQMMASHGALRTTWHPSWMAVLNEVKDLIRTTRVP